MAGKPWTRERRMEQAAKKAEKAAKEVEASPQPEVEPQEPPSGPAPTPRGNPRDEALEQLVASRNEDAGLVEPPDEEPKAEAKEEQAEEPKPEAPEPMVEPEAPKLVKVKVDGEEIEVSQEEIDDAGGVAPYRIQRASENRLKKANEALAQANQLKELLLQQAVRQTTPQPKEPSDDEFIQSKIDAIRYGTPEEGATAMREIMSRSRVDPRQITDNATSAAVVHIARTQASQQFKQEFADVATNPLLMELAGTLENKRLAQMRSEQKNPVSVDWGDFYRRIGNEIRSVVRPSQPTAPVPTNGNPSPASEKEARKASIVNLPTAAAKAELPKEEKPETREDILNEMRHKRPA